MVPPLIVASEQQVAAAAQASHKGTSVAKKKRPKVRHHAYAAVHSWWERAWSFNSRSAWSRAPLICARGEALRQSTVAPLSKRSRTFASVAPAGMRLRRLLLGTRRLRAQIEADSDDRHSLFPGPGRGGRAGFGAASHWQFLCSGSEGTSRRNTRERAELFLSAPEHRLSSREAIRSAPRSEADRVGVPEMRV